MGTHTTAAGPPRLLRAAAVGATVAALVTGGWAAATAAPLPVPLPELPQPGQTYVTPDDLHGFTPGITETGTAEISAELGAPPAGNADALVLKTPDPKSKASFLTTELAGPLETFLSSSYYAKRDAASAGSEIQFPSFQIAVDRNGGDYVPADFATLVFEPVYQNPQNTTSGTWNRYDTGAGVFCATRKIGGFEAQGGTCDVTRTLPQIIADNPGITALSAGINQGSGNPGIIGGADLIQVGTTTYNFEQKAPLPPVVPEPEPEDPTCVPNPDDPNPNPGPPPGEHPAPDGGHGDGHHPDQPDHPENPGEHPDGPPVCET